MNQPIAAFMPGVYEHYKGGKYIALNLVRHHETNEIFVVYVSCRHETVNIREYNTPGKDSWCDNVTCQVCMGKDRVCLRCYGRRVVPRFNYIGPALHQ